ncbi:MAG: trigger factor [Chitinophagaceae bacterium]|jgi:trigger factor|nr:trigger factor [Chitinophagaceae bacterium]
MATITKENIGLQHDKLIVLIDKSDYLPAFEKALKDHSKKANIPGFRKGMVPAGLIKKMYGSSVLTDEVLRTVDRELNTYLQNEKLEIFAQPLPLDFNIQNLDVNNPVDYSFSFEVGLKPEFELADLSKGNFTRYKVEATEEMINADVERLQNRSGNMKDVEEVNGDENVLNVNFIEADADGNELEGGITKDNSLLVKYFSESTRPNLIGKKVADSFIIQLKEAFDVKEREWIMGDLGLNKDESADAEKYFKVVITKVGLVEKKELNEEFFNQLYPNLNIKTEEDFRNQVKTEIEKYWDSQAANQVHDQVYHYLLENTNIVFPENFLKKWMLSQGETTKTEEQVEKEFPSFTNQLKWTLIAEKLVNENDIQVNPDDIRNLAKQQLFGYMGMSGMDEEQDWIKDYVDKMMKDKKFVEDAYHRIQTQKIFEWGEGKVNATDKKISGDEFTKIIEVHNHHH